MIKVSIFKKDKDSQQSKNNKKEEEDVFDQIEAESEPTTQTFDGKKSENNQDKEEAEEGWLKGSDEEEGQLAVDVYQTKDSIVIKSTIAGVGPEDIDVNINNDMVTIRGTRQTEEKVSPDDYFYQECYWGNFSRSIVLPQEVEAERAQASIKNGVLTILLPKAKARKPVEVKVESD